MTTSFYRRYRYAIFAFFLLLTPVVIHGARRAVRNNANRIEDWLPESFEETQRLKWFSEHFVSDELMMISWEGCTLQDPRLPRFADALRQPVSLDGQDAVRAFRDVITGDEALDRMRQPPLEMSTSAGKRRLSGWLLGRDGETSGVVVLFSADGWERRHETVQHIHDCADRVEGLSSDQIHVAGSIVDSVEIDNASNERLLALSISSFAVCFLLMLLLFRSWLLTSMVFINAIFCQQASLALIDFSGLQMDSVLLMVPLLVYVLAVSAGVHLANYYRDAVCRRGFEGAPLQAVRDAAAPCWLASLTTSLGLVSLMVSSLNPVRKFGLLASISVVIGTCVLFLLLPSQLEQVAPRRAAIRWRRQGTSGGSVWDKLLPVVDRLRYPILATAIGLTALSLYGVSRLEGSARIHDMFLPRSRLLRDYDWLEQHLGPLVPFEVVIRLPKDSLGDAFPSMLLQMQLVERVQQAVKSVDGIGAVVSAWNFCPPMDHLYGRGLRQVRDRTVFNSQLEESRHAYRQAAWLDSTPSEELWRVSGRAYAGWGLDYARVLADLRHKVEPVLRTANDQGFPGVSAIYCGGVPLVQKAQAQMLKDLVSSFVVAFGFIGVMMIVLMAGLSWSGLCQGSAAERGLVLLRSVAAGVLTMLPNILPCVLVLGAMGLLGMKIEIGSMMTASVALGIAVDDTLHFIIWFRRGLHSGSPRGEAVAFAYERCGAAMVQTSLICGLGLLVYSLSPFVPIARFSWVMFTILSAALLADLIVLPALLLTPLGSLFQSPSPFVRPVAAVRE